MLGSNNKLKKGEGTMLKSSNKAKKGFTLIELAVVVSIILILAVILIPKATAQRAASKDLSVSVSNLNRVNSGLEGYFSQATNWTTSGTSANVVAGINSYDNTILNVVTKGGQDVDVILKAATTTATLAAEVSGVTATETATATDYKSIAGATSVLAAGAFTPDKGAIVVVTCNDGLVIYGVDHNGKIVNPRAIQ